ncbi:MAG: hypothetical protein KGI97_08100 [Alphaproteobacteria bacterium]|nr:hypothetical protein [Alphaproteobacteria bacterium]
MGWAQAPVYCLFGGALRDTDCSHYYRRNIEIYDYDVRIWLPEDAFQESVRDICANLKHQGVVFDLPPEKKFSASKLARKRRTWPYETYSKRKALLDGQKIDISFVGVPRSALESPTVRADIAQDCVRHSSLSLGAIALDMDKKCWASLRYVEDRNSRRITILTGEPQDMEHAEKTRTNKFPHHRLTIQLNREPA